MFRSTKLIKGLIVGVAALGLIASPFSAPQVAEAQSFTPPPGQMLVSCPVRPAPWQVPGVEGHPGFDLQLDPSSALSILRGVPSQCIAYPGGDQATYHKIIGLRVYIPRYGIDPGSETGALARAVAIRDLTGVGTEVEREFWGTGQDWRRFVSSDGRWVYSVRGGLDGTTCDVINRDEWRRWPVMVSESVLVSCLDKIWERGGTLGMPQAPPTKVPAPPPVQTPSPASFPMTIPIPTPVQVPPPVVVPLPIPVEPTPEVATMDDLRRVEDKLDRLIDLFNQLPGMEAHNLTPG